MDENNKQQNPETQNHMPANSVQEFYERFRGVPLKKIDTFIGICIAAIILVVIIGMLDSRGFF
ncbi:MAG: hypothetical protein IJF25_04940 [Oscillospiraceae bacterium]|nr:hypothetical protein [Oscillospiraceae bacterium]MBQ4538217.1 hypothetical protein [Oscillospiraceae bacterium]